MKHGKAAGDLEVPLCQYVLRAIAPSLISGFMSYRKSRHGLSIAGQDPRYPFIDGAVDELKVHEVSLQTRLRRP